MTRADKTLVGLFVLAIVARALALTMHPAIHPDAFFQYLEPAWWHAHGYGFPTWEWRVGLRSWLVPGYYGTIYELLSWIGVREGRAVQHVITAIGVVTTALLVPAAYRTAYACAHAARAAFDRRASVDPAAHHAGVVAALVCALSPTLAYFGGQTLVENPSTLLFAFGFALYAESLAATPEQARRRALGAGALLALGACVRLSYAPLALLVGLEALLARRWRHVGYLVFAAIPVVIAFGALDRLTWGAWFHSVVEYVDYNFVQGRAAEHGVEPPAFYAERVWDRAGVALALSAALVLTRFGRAWPAALVAAVLLAYLSTQPHKEERFMLLFWPLWAIAVGVGASAARTTPRKALARGVDIATVALVACLVVVGARAHRAGPIYDYTDLYGMYEGQAYVGRQDDSTGILLGGRLHLNGGCMATGKNIPFASARFELTRNPLFNYAVVTATGEDRLWLERAGFRPVARFGAHVVLRR